MNIFFLYLKSSSEMCAKKATFEVGEGGGVWSWYSLNWDKAKTIFRFYFWIIDLHPHWLFNLPPPPLVWNPADVHGEGGVCMSLIGKHPKPIKKIKRVSKITNSKEILNEVIWHAMCPKNIYKDILQALIARGNS